MSKITIIVSGHGEFAEGIKKAVDFVAGSFSHIHFVNFTNDPDALEDSIKVILDNNPDNNILILTDLVGGTPFKVGVKASTGRDNVKVIGGLNLPMILSVVYETESEIQELADLAMQSGQGGIKAI